jgi:probable phosphoglycerate mutase
LPLETADVLTEIDHGPDENCTDSAIIARIGPEALAAWDEALVGPPDWLVDEPQRLAGWHALAQAALTAPGPLLLVTSNGAARFALKAFGQKTDKTSKLRTGAYGTLSAGPDTHYHVDTWDQRP